MVMTVEEESAAALTDALAVPAVFLHRQLRVEQLDGDVRSASRMAGIEKPPQAGAVLGVIHRMHGRFRPEHCAQRAREFLELAGEFLQHSGVVFAESLLAADVTGRGLNFDGEEDGEMLAPQGAVQCSRPVAGEPLIADGANGGVGDLLCPRMVGEQRLPVVGVGPPLNLQPSSGRGQSEQRPDPVLERIELLETRAPQIRRFQPEALRDQATAFRRAEDYHSLDHPAVRSRRVGLRMGYGFAVPRKIGATEEIVQLVPVIAGGFAVSKSQNPY